MDQLITDGLSYSKVAYGDFGLEPVDLHELVNDLVDTYPNLQRDRLDLMSKSVCQRSWATVRR